MTRTHIGQPIDSVENFSVLECQECNFRHLDPIPCKTTLDDFYSQQYYQSHKPTYIQQDEKDKKYLEISYDERLVVDKKKKRIICISCTNGKRHDFRLFKEPGVHIHPEIKSLTDTGYQGIHKLHHNSELQKKKTKQIKM